MHDPGANVEIVGTMVHWPKSRAPWAPNRKLEIIYPPKTSSDTKTDAANHERQVRLIVQGVYLGEAALNSMDYDVAAARAKFNARYSGRANAMATDLCGRLVAPLGLVQVGRIASSEYIPDGSVTARLWHPAYASPRITLRRIQTALKQMQLYGRLHHAEPS